MKAHELKQKFQKLEKAFYSPEAIENNAIMYSKQNKLQPEELNYVRPLVKKITGLIINNFDPYSHDIDTYEGDAATTINTLRKIVGGSFTVAESYELSPSSFPIYLFSIGHKESVIDCFKALPDTYSNNPAALEKYIELAKRVTKSQVGLITQTILSNLPHTARHNTRAGNDDFVSRFANKASNTTSDIVK
jgi:hypothetical protein